PEDDDRRDGGGDHLGRRVEEEGLEGGLALSTGQDERFHGLRPQFCDARLRYSSTMARWAASSRRFCTTISAAWTAMVATLERMDSSAAALASATSALAAARRSATWASAAARISRRRSSASARAASMIWLAS